MAVPFSNTRLRVPRGFAALLEGLAREVLRDQPEDIPAYAALHFDGLLKEREESGMDYAEWAAKLEDRFYNNHAFKAGHTSPKVSPVKDPTTEKTASSEEMSSPCQTEDDASFPTTSKPSASGHVPRSGDKEDDDVTEMERSQVESDNRLTDTDASADETSGDNEARHSKSEAAESSSFNADEEEEPGMTDDEQGQKKDISAESEETGDSAKDTQSQEMRSSMEKSADESADEEVLRRAQELLGKAEKALSDKPTGELESTEEEASYSGLADVDTELGMTEDESAEIFQKKETHVESQKLGSSMEMGADESADEEVLRRAQELLGKAEKTLSDKQTSELQSTEEEVSQKKETHVESQELRADESADEEVLRRAQELLGKAEKTLESTEEEVSGLEDVDVCASELGTMEKSADESADEEVLRRAQELLGKAEKTLSDKQTGELKSTEEEASYSGLADEDVCAAELRRAQELLGKVEKTLSDVVAVDDPSNVHSSEQETSTEKMDKISEHSSPLSQTEPLETSLQEMDEMAEESLAEEEDAKPGSGETQEVSPVDGDSFEGVPETDTEDEPKEEAFVEISFEDVPEIQEKLTDEECVSEASQTQLLEETSEELAEEEAQDTQDQKEAITEMDTAEKEVTAEAEETTDQHERVDSSPRKIDQSDSDSDHSEKKVETVEEDKAAGETLDHQVDGNDEADEIKKEDDENGDIKMEDTSESTEPNSSQTARSNLPGPEGEDKEIKTVEADNAETRSEARETIPVELQPPDGVEETDERACEQQVSEEREKVAEGTIDSEGRGKDDSVDEKQEGGGIILPAQTAEAADGDSPDNHNQPAGSEKDTTDPQRVTDDKEECSRPQEEEDIMDIPLDDPEANKAAAKIQAGFRGHMTRKKIKPEHKAEGEEVSSTGEDAETGGSRTVERDDTSVPEQ